MDRRSNSLLALTWLAFFMADVRDGLGPFLATYLQESRVQQELIGYTMTAGGLAAVAVTPLAGAWVDRSKAKRAMTAVAALAISAASAMAFTTLSGPLLVASQVVTGVAGALLAAAMAALTLGLAREQGFKHQTGRNEAFSHAGNMISAIGAGCIAHLFGAPWMLAVMGAMTAGALLSVWKIRASDIDHDAARGDEPQDAAPADADAQGHAPIRALFGNRPLLLFALACAFFHLGNAAMLPLLNQRLAATVADSAPLLWTGVAIVVAQLTMIPVAVWVAGSRRLDVAHFVYAAILVLPLRGALAYAFTSEWNNIPVQILDGFAAGILGVATPLLVQRYTRGTGRFNTALGLVMTLQGIGAAVSSGLANAVVGAEQHFGLAFVVLAAAAALALPVFWLAQRSAGGASAVGPVPFAPAA
ncbi:MFS transporter [Variovorax sp. OV329]|uniref:MFS transporter n=1 Tax=Variovorax sp. OV329 TaxID=1882825 RepID=UPI0008E87957|nr:MFS transporter [Variovorax sp. OV329]SFM75147.1 Major Facilitator Superfamily protein [Variovorax sp. OV329]